MGGHNTSLFTPLTPNLHYNDLSLCLSPLSLSLSLSLSPSLSLSLCLSPSLSLSMSLLCPSHSLCSPLIFLSFFSLSVPLVPLSLSCGYCYLVLRSLHLTRCTPAS